MEETHIEVRVPEGDDVETLAAIWHEGWHDAHAALMPAELTHIRTLESFRERLASLLPETRVAGARGVPTGFCMLKDDELYQLFVARAARGLGVAQALVADAESRLQARGVTTAWLACAIGNDRAARFYEKSGWTRAGTIRYRVETSSGPFEMDVWRFEKRLGPAAESALY